MQNSLGGKGNYQEEIIENKYEESIPMKNEKNYNYNNNKKYQDNTMSSSNKLKSGRGNINYNSGFNEDDELPEGVLKIEKNEKFTVEKGAKIKITKIVRYMENGEINTELFKTKL